MDSSSQLFINSIHNMSQESFKKTLVIEANELQSASKIIMQNSENKLNDNISMKSILINNKKQIRSRIHRVRINDMPDIKYWHILN